MRRILALAVLSALGTTACALIVGLGRHQHEAAGTGGAGGSGGTGGSGGATTSASTTSDTGSGGAPPLSPADSCAAILKANKSAVSKVYTLDPGGAGHPFDA